MHVAYTSAILHQRVGGGGGRSTFLEKKNFLPEKIELGKACQANISAHSMLSQRDFLCSFSQETRESSSPSVLYSWVFAGFLGYRSFSFIAHFSSLFMSYIELSYFKLQQPAANHTFMIGWSFSINTEFLSYAETNILFHDVFASYCSLWLHVRVCVWKRNKASNIYLHSKARVC